MVDLGRIVLTADLYFSFVDTLIVKYKDTEYKARYCVLYLMRL